MSLYYKKSIKIRLNIIIFLIIFFNLIFSQNYPNWRDLTKEYETLLSKDPKNLEILFKLLVIYSAQGRLDRAYDIFKKINSIDPNFLNKKAEEIVEKSNDPFSLYQIAFASYFGNKKDKALTYFQKLYEIFPKDGWIISFLAYLYYEREDIKETERLINEGLKINNENELLHAIKCVVYYKKGNYILALKEYFTTLGIIQKKGYREIWELLKSLVY